MSRTGPESSLRLDLYTQVDSYGTAGPHTIIRQHLDYGHWYCRNKLSQKDVHNTQ